MADKKISALTGASTPLAGTEVLPIVQSGSTVKVSVANLTAGRAVATAGGSFTDNIVQSTAAKGVNFTANTPAAGMTSQLLNWYEEGTWTPTLVAAGVNFTSVTYDAVTGGRYTRIGNVVHIQGRLRTDAVTVGSASGDVCIGNLPFTAVANGGSTSNGASAISIGYVAANWAANRAPISGQVAANTTQIELYYRSAVDGTCVNLVPADVGTGADANTVYFAGTYIVS